MTKSDAELRIVNVLDPTMCLHCRYAHIAEVLFTDGATKKMFYCSRLDCDNWSTVPETSGREIETDEKD